MCEIEMGTKKKKEKESRWGYSMKGESVWYHAYIVEHVKRTQIENYVKGSRDERV